MRKLFITGIGFFLIGFVSAQSVSPELVSAAGEHYENTSYQLDWSIGEIAVETYSNASYVLTQGFHQNTYTVTSVDKLAFSDADMKAYPNPASDFITIESSDDTQKELTVELSDIQGKVYLIEKYTATKKKVNLEHFSKGIYFLNVKSEGKTIKSFKIIKN